MTDNQLAGYRQTKQDGDHKHGSRGLLFGMQVPD
jgi:hypothetical protein